jgi:hypothetical protein
MRHAFLVLLLCLPLGPTSSRAQSVGPCLANPDTAAVHLTYTKQQVSIGDSASTVAFGIPWLPVSQVTIVTDSVTCSQVIAAFNGLFPPADSSKHIQHAYVMRLGTHGYALVSEKLSLSGPLSYFFFDSAFSRTAEIGAQ